MVARDLVAVNTLAYGCAMSDKQRLDKVAWIQAGFRALCVKGPAGLKAEPLARELGVSKGSFYWHFADLSAFRAAMVDYWVQVATQGIIEAVDAVEGTPAERLAALVEVATEPPPEAVGGKHAEGAIRCWARADSAVAEQVLAVDSARIEYCSRLFREHGLERDTAQLHGRLLYAGLIGLEYLDQAGLSRLRGDLQVGLQRLL